MTEEILPIIQLQIIKLPIIKSSELLCFNLILFYSKSCKLKMFPAVIPRVFIFVMSGPSQKALDVSKVVSLFVINVAYFEHVLQLSNL